MSTLNEINVGDNQEKKSNFNFLIWHHLGLGDHIICNGLVRELIRKNNNYNITLTCQQHNLESVKSMYKDLKINFLIWQNDDTINSQYGNFQKICKIGFNDLDLYSTKTVEEQFYTLAEIDFEHKYLSSKFPFIDRDENSCIFVHDDQSRNMSIPINGPNVYRPNNQYKNILDYIPILIRAKEIHVIESSFMHLIECLPYITDNLNIHKIRNIDYPAEQPKLCKNWNIIKNV